MKKIKGRNGGIVNIMENGDKALPNAGHPGGKNFKTIAKEYLNGISESKNPLTGETQKLSGMEMIFLHLLKIISSSDSDTAKISAIKEILERVEGKVTQPIDVEGDAFTKKIEVGVVHVELPLLHSEQDIDDNQKLLTDG